MPGLRAGQVELTLQIVAGDLDVLHRHLGLDVAEERHQCRQAYAGANHLTGICVSKLVRNDASGNADGGRASDRYGRSCLIRVCLPLWRASSRPSTGADRKSGRSVSVGRVHIQTSPPGPFVPSSACREARESPNGPGRHCGGNHRKGRRIRRCACRYGEAAGTRWPADHCGGVTPAGLIDPALPSAGGANVEECAECPRDGSDEPDREAVQSRQAPPEWTRRNSKSTDVDGRRQGRGV